MVFAGQREIKEYWEGLAHKHNIGPRIELFTEVVSATWGEAAQLYTIALRDVRGKEMRQVKAHVVISAVGLFHKPKFPDIPGRDRFKGPSMHSSKWNHSVELSGKKVAVVGNGRSGDQIVQELSNDPSTHIVQFCRSPTWFVAKPQVVIPEAVKWAFRNIPLCEKLFRWLIAFVADVFYFSWKNGPWATAVRQLREQVSIHMVTSQAPEKYHQHMIPKYPLGCKPYVFDPGYLASLQRQNIELEWDLIANITEDGVITESGTTYNFDVICYATGFDTEGSQFANVTGLGGRLMRDYYKEEGGPTAYMGTTTPGFPNWLTLLGPNIATG
ncbi:hypothetical protein FRC07_001013 [Ceratobasidium sp. 392]|nr:hypothetical protein FRC07_001013 [Ceratobasidium sp. 392]